MPSDLHCSEDRDVPAAAPPASAPAQWPRYGRPLDDLTHGARCRRLKKLDAHPLVAGLQQKVCAMCCAARPLDAFRPHCRGVFGRVAHCIVCAPAVKRLMATRHGGEGTAYHRQRRFGIDGETFNRMLAVQGGRCAICGTDDPGDARGWAFDHDHVTGRGRGILCARCNRGIGFLQDDPALLEVAARYVREGGHRLASELAVAAQGDPSRYRGYRR